MALSVTRRSRFWVAPLLAITACGLAACGNSQQSSTVPGTTPPVFTPSPGAAGETTPGGPAQPGTKIDLKGPDGASMGTANITEEGSHLRITVDAQNLTEGFHGLHIHEKGVCEPNSTAPTGGPRGNFLSAGGHLHSSTDAHHPAGGDLTSLQVRKDGHGQLTTTTDAITMADVHHRALLIHAGPDNFANIPSRYSHPGGTGPDQTTVSTGDAGDRVACGVIE